MLSENFTVLGLTTFTRPNPRLVVALSHADAAGVLELGRDATAARAALRETARYCPGPFGVRVDPAWLPTAEDLPDAVDRVVLPLGVDPAPFARWTTLVEVTSLDEARAALTSGADELIAVGCESGGRVGAESLFVLLQRLVQNCDAPIWARGGIGLHTAAACRVAGARGVVLDSQLALVRESNLPAATRQAIASMDGSETTLLASRRVFSRPDLELVTAMNDASAEEVDARLGCEDLERELLPIGQDAAFASVLADRFGTAGGVVQAIRRAVDEHLRDAADARPLAEGSPLAVEHGTRFPLVQGPMTRVSDRAAFADAVEAGGGLPFLALALLRREQADTLVRETAATMGDRPWGVGILGFVPAELRAEQLEVLTETRPPFAIIAGGRPAQARALEEQGTRTYLHVPSPGLLELFLNEGARRFVFEGRECGGHVGPRTSFALWEQQIEILMGFEHPEELSVLFAGGVHDGLSGAMVAAMAAPLAARGAKVGALMGTAYLFTREAVASGAIQPAYQQMAVDCRDTVLLGTGPGHATRCVESDYVRAFRDEKERLQAEGLEPRALWEKLEGLNLGRLRLASKGIKREGSALLEVDAAEQTREGMYMIGQVAALRDERTGVEDLHRDVCDGATERLERSAAAAVPASPASPADVAVVGMACIFPEAPDLATFWSNLVGGVDTITEVDPLRWNPELYYDPDGRPGQETPSKWGGFLPPVTFDPTRYGITPRSLSFIEPAQCLALQVAQQALEDAGYAQRDFPRERTSVIFGAEGGMDMAGAIGFRALFRQYGGELPAELDAALPEPTEDTFPGVLTNVIAGRIANRLDLGGFNYTVDAACASALAAIECAAQTLVSGSSDMVIAGGVDLHNSINDYLMFSGVHALSPQGKSRPFDRSADGIVLGEGIGVVVLKRLADAERDGDRIYSVIRGISGSSDGKSLGLTAPRQEGQMRALERAYAESGVSPSEVGLMEAHGTGTVVGDRTELASMTAVYRAAGAAERSCVLGSVKSQIGHTKCAAGVASLIKVSLSVYHGVQTPATNLDEPLEELSSDESPFTVLEQARPWPAARRIAALSSFGFGGSNFHAVVSNYEGMPAEERGLDCWPVELFLVRGVDREAARATIDKLQSCLDVDEPWTLRRLAASCSAYGEGPVQVAVVARDHDELATALGHARAFEARPGSVFVREAESPSADGKTAFLFPGQGSQRPGMLADWFVAFPQLGVWLAEGHAILDRLYPARAFEPRARAAQKEALQDTRVAQPALGLCEMAMVQVFERLGLSPDMLAGHSYGEVVALCAAGAIDAGDLLALSETRAQSILASTGEDPGAMAAVAASAEDIEPHLGEFEDVVLANHNSPRQTVLAGPSDSIARCVAHLKEAGLSAKALPVACAFHSPVVAGADVRFAKALEKITVRKPSTTVWSNTTGEAYPRSAAAIRERLAEHLVEPVQFRREIEAMYADGARVFVEMGPGRVLSGLVADVLGDRPHLVVSPGAHGAMAGGGPSGLQHLLAALATLAVHDVAFDAAALYADRDAEVFDLAAPPSRAFPKLAWRIDGFRAVPVNGTLAPEAMHPSVEPPVRLVAAGSDAARAGSGDDLSRDQALTEYLANVRELAESQRQVMLSFLGTPPETAAAQVVAPSNGASNGSGNGASAHGNGQGNGASPAAGNGAQNGSNGNGATEPSSSENLTETITELLLRTVSERTGYPEEMLDLDLDLEADLSIDSIKRIEILGALNTASGLADGMEQDQEEVVEELAGLKTLRAIIEWIEDRADEAPDAAGADPAAAEPESDPSGASDPPAELGRYVLEVRERPARPDAERTLEGHKLALIKDDRGVAAALKKRLEAAGAHVRLLGPSARLNGECGLIHLTGLSAEAGHDSVKSLFRMSRKILSGEPRLVFAASGMGGSFGIRSNGSGKPQQGGVSGLLKTVAKEFPDVRVRAIDLDPKEPVATLAEQLFQELLIDDGAVEVGYAGGARRALEVVASSWQPDAAPADSVSALDADSVVLVTGGARGITAHAALEIARRFGCRLELVGRTPLPPAEEPLELASARTEIELRRALIALHPGKKPAEIGAKCRRVQADREILATLREAERLGARVRYHSLDVRDREAFAALLDQLYEEHGRIDGVIHGAGVVEDKLIRHKTPKSFDRVFDTKVVGALTLAEKLRPDLKFMTFFSSVSGAFGNRGQADYAAANDVLDKLALYLNERGEARVFSVNWGPWDAGMVSPELRREYGKRGIGLIPLEDGSSSLVSEICHGSKDDAQVIVMNARPESLR